MAYLNKPIEVIDYPEALYKFNSRVRDMFGLYPELLSDLHKQWAPTEVFTRETDQNTPYHRRFYKLFDAVLRDAYRDFVREVAEPLMGEPVVFQKTPTFRIQFPNNLAVGEKHRDSDYNHLTEAVNFWVPLTDVNKHNAIWTEAGPITCKYGQVVVFDGANIEHWNVHNKSNKTRVSFDLRVVPKSKFKGSKKKTINTGLKMDVGGYYDEL